MNPILGTTTIIQIGFVVKDIEATKKKFAQFFGMEEPPPTIGAGEYENTKTTYLGQPAPKANVLMAFFDLGNTQLELLQPNGQPSAWQDHLDKHGEGFHHIAFHVKNTDEKIKTCENFGMKCIQRGKYGDGSGEYTYLDAMGSLKCLVELLESY